MQWVGTIPVQLVVEHQLPALHENASGRTPATDASTRIDEHRFVHKQVKLRTV
jgi:hypothetical protein